MWRDLVVIMISKGRSDSNGRLDWDFVVIMFIKGRSDSEGRSERKGNPQWVLVCLALIK